MSGKIRRINFLTISFLLLVWMFGAMMITSSAFAESKDEYYEKFVFAGNLYLRSGNYDEALREFRKAAERYPLNQDVLIGLVRAYSRTGDFDKAQKHLNAFRDKHPYDMRSHLISGEFFASKGHQEEAASHFIRLIEMGIYRFEALQALIPIYAESGDERYKSIIRKSIALYEPVNKKVLYRILFTSLELNGKSDEADIYRKIHDSLYTEIRASRESQIADAHNSEVEMAVSEARFLMSQGAYRAAEELIAQSARKWPSETRFHELLKICYMNLLENTPMQMDKGVLPGRLPAGRTTDIKTTESSRFSELIPNSGMLTSNTRMYVNKVSEISAKSERYFNRVINGITDLEKRVEEDAESMSDTESSEVLEAHLKELRQILNECNVVLSEEVSALEKLSPPESFNEFHKYYTETNRVFIKYFNSINAFITDWNWDNYNDAMRLLNEASKRMNFEKDLFNDAVQMELERLRV